MFNRLIYLIGCIFRFFQGTEHTFAPVCQRVRSSRRSKILKLIPNQIRELKSPPSLKRLSFTLTVQSEKQSEKAI